MHPDQMSLVAEWSPKKTKVTREEPRPTLAGLGRLYRLPPQTWSTSGEDQGSLSKPAGVRQVRPPWWRVCGGYRAGFYARSV